MSIYFSKKPRFKKALFFTLTLFIATNSLAWDGYDYANSSSVEIGSGNLVREGNIIQIYDGKTGQYHDVEVKLVQYNFNSTRLEVFDLYTKKPRILEMNND
jgi:hypothetical protein